MEKPIPHKLDPVPDLILPGTIEYIRKHNPFRPSSRNAEIPNDIFTTPIDTSTTKPKRVSTAEDKQHINELLEKKKFKETNNIQDIKVKCFQSKKVVKLTTSMWHPREGRLNIDKASILTMGSGLKDIRNLGRLYCSVM